MIQPFTEWLADALERTIGTDLFGGPVPAEAVDAVSAVLESSPAVLETADTSRSHWTAHYQIYARADTYYGARGLAYHCYEFLVGKSVDYPCGVINVAITGWLLESIAGEGPRYLGRDAKGRHGFAAEIEIKAKKTT